MNNCYTPRRALPKKVNGGAPKTRGDGRQATQLRRVYMDLGVVSEASGSAYVEMDQTKVICAVYGPRAQGMDSIFSEEGELRCDFRIAPFAGPSRPETRGQSDIERETSAVLQQALESSVRLELLTKSAVDVYVTVLAGDGSEIAAAIVCASLAIIDAGIECFDVVAACSVALGEDGQVHLDSTREEEETSSGRMMVAVMPSSQSVTSWWQQGRMDGASVSKAIELCTDGCSSIHALMRTRLIAPKTVKE